MIDRRTRGLALIGALFTSVLLGVVALHPWQSISHNDLPQFYTAAKLVSAGQISRLYDRTAYVGIVPPGKALEKLDSIYFNRPAFQAVILWPVSFLSYAQFEALAVALNYLLFGMLIWLLPKWFGGSWFSRVWLFSFEPFLHALALGQDTLILTLLIAYGAHLVLSKRGWQGGAVIALGCFKPHVIWAIPLVFAARKEWRALGAFLAVAFALIGASLLLIGPRGVSQWIDILQSPTTDIGPANMGNLRALTINFGYWLAIPAGLLGLGAFLFIVARQPMKTALISALFVGPLLVPHSYLQDYGPTAIAALLTGQTALRALVLIPWPYFYPGNASGVPFAFIGVAFLTTTALVALRQDRSCSWVSRSVKAALRRWLPGGAHRGLSQKPCDAGGSRATDQA